MGGRIIAMDLTSESGLVKAVNTVIEEQKRIDILINNAGAALPGSIEDIPISQARDLFEVNLFGSARLTSLFYHICVNKGREPLLTFRQ